MKLKVATCIVTSVLICVAGSCKEKSYDMRDKDGKSYCVPCLECPHGQGASAHCGSIMSVDHIIECQFCADGKTFSSAYDAKQCTECQSLTCERQHKEWIGNCNPEKDNSSCTDTCTTGYFMNSTQHCLPCSYCGDAKIHLRIRKCIEDGMPPEKQCKPHGSPNTTTTTTTYLPTQTRISGNNNKSLPMTILTGRNDSGPQSSDESHEIPVFVPVLAGIAAAIVIMALVILLNFKRCKECIKIHCQTVDDESVERQETRVEMVNLMVHADNTESQQTDQRDTRGIMPPVQNNNNDNELEIMVPRLPDESVERQETGVEMVNLMVHDDNTESQQTDQRDTSATPLLNERSTVSTEGIKDDQQAVPNSIGYLPYNVYAEVCEMLNAPLQDKDWKAVAGKMGCSTFDVKRYEMKFKDNPTDALLTHWGTERGNDLDRLVKILKEINRDDVIEIIQA